MGENQKAIYYLATDSLKSAKTAPFLEKLVQKDIEVCILCEFCLAHNKLITYEGNLGCKAVEQIVGEDFFNKLIRNG